MGKTDTKQLTLAIESAIAGGSLSLIHGKTEIASWTGSADRSKAEELLVNIDEMLTSVDISRRDLDLIAVSAGPGSFTGIRIGIATALGLKTGLGIPMSSVSALNAIAGNARALSTASSVTVAVPVGKNSICVQEFENGLASSAPRTVRDSEFGEMLHDASIFILHQVLFEKYGSRPNTNDLGANIALAVGLAASPGVVDEPLFVSKSFSDMSRIAPEQCEDSRIRPVEASHVAELIRIGEETNLSPWSAQSYLDEMKNPDAVMLRMVNDDNANIGFVVGRLIPTGDIEPRTDAEIYNIAVVRPEQRRGCGQSLFEAFRKVCFVRNAANIWLEVRESNEAALRFYEKNGFERVQSRNHFYENPREHAILMRLPLK